jgi:hypothetical protein
LIRPRSAGTASENDSAGIASRNKSNNLASSVRRVGSFIGCLKLDLRRLGGGFLGAESLANLET